MIERVGQKNIAVKVLKRAKVGKKSVAVKKTTSRKKGKSVAKKTAVKKGARRG